MHLQPIYLLDEEEILERAVTIDEFSKSSWLYKKPGVYFLIDDNPNSEDAIIFYIGSTGRSIRKRVKEHLHAGLLISGVYGQELPDEHIYRAMEILYIGELAPYGNKLYV